MGKTKTAVISGSPDETKSGKEKYKEKKKQKKEKDDKVRVPGLGGGERVVAVGAELPEEGSEPSKEKGKEKKEEALQRRKGQEGRGKNYKTARKKIDKSKRYSVKKAVDLIKDISFTKFDATIELHLVVKKDNFSKQAELPHSTGKQKKIEIANENTIKNLKKGKIDFDILLATKDMMPKLVPFAKDLGPKGLMPNPKNGTLIKDKKEADKFKGNALTLKTERKAPLIHTHVGKVKQDKKELIENIEAVLDTVGKRQIERAFLTATMTPSVRLKV